MQKDKNVASHTTETPKGKPQYDWAEVKKDYIENGLTFTEICKKYGMVYSTIDRKVKREGWRKLREKIAIKVEEKTIEQIADSKASINDIAMKALRIATEKAMAGLSEVDVHDSRAIKDYMSILKDLRDIGAISVETQSSEVVVSFKDFDEEGVIE